MKPDYKNWVPNNMLIGLWAGFAIVSVLFVLLGATEWILHGTARLILAIVLGIAATVLLFYAIWMTSLHRAFDYNGKRRMAKTIIDGTAAHVTLPDGGTGLDIGCGSGALTIASAKRNPNASMVGCDIWSGGYKTVFSQKLCEQNAKTKITCLDYSADMMKNAERRADAMHIQNVTFVQGDVGALPFSDESFDIVLSLNGFHAFPDKDAAYRETHRVLKKDGIFCGCFYIAEEFKRTDWFVKHMYVPKKFFTPPFETKESLQKRLDTLYPEVNVHTVNAEGIFCCVK